MTRPKLRNQPGPGPMIDAAAVPEVAIREAPPEVQVLDAEVGSVEPVEPVREPAAEPPPIRRVSLEIPLCPALVSGYLPRTLQVPLRGGSQKSIVQRLRLALTASDAQLASGKHVESNADAVRWLLDAIAAGNGG